MSVRETLGQSPGDPREPDRQVGRYEVRSQIGRGGFGAVYRAFDPQLQRDVALKVLMRASPKARQRFAREVQAVARLRHPNIVSIHDSGEEGGRPYLVMEFVDGQTFEELVREGRLDLRARVEIVRDVALAIQYAHDQGVLHRDLKPENVLVDAHQQAQVLDFGLAYLEEESGLQRLSISGIPMGTPAYMAPEQASGRRPDHRTDVWGLGGVLYFALAREGPFERFNNPLIAVQNEPVKPPRAVDPQIPAALERICMRCLAKPAEERYPSPRDLAAALSAYLERGESPLRLPAGPAGQVALMVCALLLAVAAGVLVFTFTRTAPPATAASPQATTSPTPPPSSGSPTPSASPSPDGTPASAQAVEVRRTLAKARELATKLLDSQIVLGELESAARRARGDRDLEEEVALATVRHHIRRAELEDASATLESFPWKSAGLADRLRLELYLAMEDEPRAKKTLPRLAQGDPTAVGTVLGKAWLQYLEEDDPDAALYTGRRAVELEPDDVYALLFVARLYLVRDDLRRAADYLERAREAAPDDHRPLELLALLLQEEDPRAAVGALDDLIHLLGSRATANHFANRGVLRSRIQDLEGAEADLKQALERDAGNFIANLSLGVRYLQRDDAETAGPYLRAAREREPEAFRLQLLSFPGPMRDVIRELVGLNDASRPLSEALEGYLRTRSEEAEPPARAAILDALTLAARGRPWAEIAARLNDAQRAAPDSAVVALEQVRLACRRDAFLEAEQALTRARALGLDNPELVLLEAELHGRKGEFVLATKRYEEVARQAPETPQGRTAAATLAMLEGDYEQALALATSSLEQDPTQTACRAIELVCLTSLATPADARRRAELAIDTYGLIDSRLALGRFRAKLGELGVQIGRGQALSAADYQALLDECAALGQLTEGVEPALLTASFLLSNPGPAGLEQAERLLQEALDLQANRPGIHMQWGRLHVQRGDQDAALASFRRCHELGLGQLPVGVTEEFQRAFGSAGPLERIFAGDAPR